MKTFKEFVANITKDDVDLYNKLDNMVGSEITSELADFVISTPDVYERVERCVMLWADEYEDFIVSETEKLYEQELIESEDDYASGLYNCDAVYMRAILYTLGCLWIPSDYKGVYERYERNSI
jgi:hypothetical protein